jgi:hypothetical protein
MADLCRATRCDGCGGSHDLYDTSTVRHAPGGTYRYTRPATRFVVRVWWLGEPEVVSVVPADAVPMEWVADGVARGPTPSCP